LSQDETILIRMQNESLVTRTLEYVGTERCAFGCALCLSVFVLVSASLLLKRVPEGGSSPPVSAHAAS
jgi:hypothetical protein